MAYTDKENENLGLDTGEELVPEPEVKDLVEDEFTELIDSGESFDTVEELCPICNKRTVDGNDGSGSRYCSVCRKDMLKTPLRWQGFIAAVFAILFSGVGFILMAFTGLIANTVSMADSFAKGKQMTGALNYYHEAYKLTQEYNSQLKADNLFNYGTRSFVKEMKITALTQSPLTVGQNLLQANVESSAFNRFKLRSLMQHKEIYEKFMETRKAVEPIFIDYEETEAAKIPYDEIIAKLDKLKEGENADKYSPYIIEYYKTYAAVIAEKGTEAELEHMLKVKELAPEAGWLYNYYLADCYNRLGDTENLLKICDDLISENKNSIQAYSLKARTLATKGDMDGAFGVYKELESYNAGSSAAYALSAELHRRNGDVDKAIEVCEEGFEKSEANTELFRQYAILQLLKGDKEKAYKAASDAYNSSYYSRDETLELINTVALCAKLAGEEEMYEESVAFLEEHGQALAPSVVGVIDGTLTLQDVFLKGKGDVL
ncbi:MAG TPA: hypothetical protein P5127_00450 [Oscillospiraceae bacterium]|nr:hypothetical protein [Oscillospiraceae bacterium]